MINDFINAMRGVDRVDQQCGSYRPGSRTLRWWVPLAWGIINLAIHNTYVIHLHRHAAAGTKPMTNFAFRLSLAKKLINGYRGRKRAGRPRQLPPDAKHRLVYTTNKLDCCICSKRNTGGKQVQSRYGCSTCNVSLCVLCYDKHRGEE